MTAHRENAAETPADSQSDSSDPHSPAFRDLRSLPGKRSQRGGAHRIPSPPHAVKGRAAVVAVAAGAVVAGGQTLATAGTSPDGGNGDGIALAASSGPMLGDLDDGSAQGSGSASEGAAGSSADGPAQGQAGSASQGGTAETAPDDGTGSLEGSAEVLNAPQEVQQAAEIADQIAKGAESAAESAAEHAASLAEGQKPLYVKPTSGTLTSNYGNRWGDIHGGIDIANEMYTPIHAATDGEVVSAGPASGFGQWVRVKADDGTMTVYGHIETIEVKKGQRVTAGDEIAKMGSRGFSTGPHLHFEVWENDGQDRIDPAPWLAERGIALT